MGGKKATTSIIPGEYGLSVGNPEIKHPKGWEYVLLSDIATLATGHTPSRKIEEYWGGDIPWMSVGDARKVDGKSITVTKEYTNQKGIDNSAAVLLPKGTVCLSRTASIGYSVILGTKMATSQGFVNWVCSDLLLPRFLQCLFLAERRFLNSISEGTAHTTIYFPEVKAFNLALPSISEQQRIVTKLNGLFTRLEDVKTRLKKVPALLKIFRQSILNQAVTGALSEEWRKDKEFDSEYFQSVENIHLKKKKPVKIRGKKGFDENENPYQLPNFWKCIPNYKLTVDGGNAICAGPFGTIFKAKDFRTEGIPIIFLRHVKSDGFNQKKPNYMEPSVWEEYHQEYSIHGGELLITKLGDPPGDATVFPKDFGVAMVTPDVMKADYNEELFSAKYGAYFFNSTICKDIIAEVSYGITRQRIDLTMFKSFPIPVPSRNEQVEIVNIVESLFTKIAIIEEKYNNLKSQIEQLPKSILAKAFKGELVDQLPTDIDTKDLLKEIQKLKLEVKTRKVKTKTKSKDKKINKIKNEHPNFPLYSILIEHKNGLTKNELYKKSKLKQHKFLIQLNEEVKHLYIVKDGIKYYRKKS